MTLSYDMCNSLSFDMSYHAWGCFAQKSLPEKSLKFSQLSMAEFSTCKWTRNKKCMHAIEMLIFLLVSINMCEICTVCRGVYPGCFSCGPGSLEALLYAITRARLWFPLVLSLLVWSTLQWKNKASPKTRGLLLSVENQWFGNGVRVARETS